MQTAQAETLPSDLLSVRGRSFRIAVHPVVAAGAREFTSGFEDGTLRFFDAVLPGCDQLIDCGAYVGFTSLYAARHGVTVEAFEPNPVNFAFLAANVAVNPDLLRRIQMHNAGIGPRDERVTLYAKGYADSGSSIFQVVERGEPLVGQSAAIIDVRAATAALAHVGPRTLVKIDIEGAEYDVLPALGPLLAERKPWLHVSFHPFNLAAGLPSYEAAIQRLRAGLMVAEALSSYRHIHLFADGAWSTISEPDRLDFLRHYLLRAKPVPRIASAQYGFIDGVAFSDQPLPLGA